MNQNNINGALTFYDWPSYRKSIPRDCYKSPHYKCTIYSHLNDGTKGRKSFDDRHIRRNNSVCFDGAITEILFSSPFENQRYIART